MTRTLTHSARANAGADILCIGAQRAMTSWLHHVIAAHPGAWAFPNFDPVTSTSKEAHYWDWNRRRGPDWYRVLMRPLSDDALSLDFTPDYAFLNDDQITECHALSPSAKVIYILRDPLARAVSAIRMRTLWATNNAGAKAHRVTYGREFLNRCHHARLWDHGAYSANVVRWRRKYPDLLVLNYEQMRAAPLAAALSILEHCGLDTDALPKAAQTAIRNRATQKIWQSPEYALDSDCLAFLHGVTWHERATAKQELGMVFHEGDALTDALTGAPA